MAQRRTKPKSSKVPAPDVMTLAEAAAHLRISEAEVLQMVRSQDLPGRLLGTEWRFLKSAINEWLRTPPKRGSKEAVLSTIGSWKDDPFLDEMLRKIYEQRGRPMTEDEK